MADKHDGKKPKRQLDSVSKEAGHDIKREVLLGVGYRRPPEHTRFQKGQSGNPKGRPKRLGVGGNPHARALILREAERLVTIREGEETRQMPAIEVILRSQTKAAANGNAYAQKNMIEWFTWADGEREAESAAFAERAKRYVAICREEIAEAERKGEPPPAPLPHPDDIVIDDENRVRLIGPVNMAELAKLEETIKVREILIMQDALDYRLANTPEGVDPPGTALLFARILDNGVPARFRLSEAEWIKRMARYDRMPQRELFKAVYRTWKEFGRPVSRGRTFPALRWGEQQVEEAAAVLDKIAGERQGV